MPLITIYKDTLRTMKRAVDLTHERGGYLLGHFTEDGYQISLATYSDSDDTGATYWHASPEHRLIAEKFASKFNLDYLGFWHTHPSAYIVRPSGNDVKVWRDLASRRTDPLLTAIFGVGIYKFYLTTTDRIHPVPFNQITTIKELEVNDER